MKGRPFVLGSMGSWSRETASAPVTPESVRAQLPLSTYRLPEGTLIDVDSTACKGAPMIDFTRADGSFVKASLVTYRPEVI
jgi:hypothetical protein